MVARKPRWVKPFCEAGRLTARRCGTCSAWLIVDSLGVEESYDASILSRTEAASALADGRRIALIMPSASGQFFFLQNIVRTESLADGTQFLCRHECGLKPIGTEKWKGLSK